METPILFIIFKRYDTTYNVFQAIRKAKPSKLYIAADAPRAGKLDEVADCEKTRSIVNLIDWPCQVKTLFQKENLGCGIGPATAISWFFKNEEMGIILEDDCVPTDEFFTYCEHLLNKYKDNPKVSLITGRNPLSKCESQYSYIFSALHFCWGWASWRRVWEKYDYDIKDRKLWDYYKHLKKLYPSNIFIRLWRMNIFMNTKRDQKRDYWDFQFVICTQFNNSYTIVPKYNLIRNIGFDVNATHTFAGTDNVEVGTLNNILDPNEIRHDTGFDVKYGLTRYKPYRLLWSFPKNLIKYAVWNLKKK